MKQGFGKFSAVAVAIGLLAGCAQQINRAPVEDRTFSGNGRPLPVMQNPAVNPNLPGAHNAGRPGYYIVRPGDTLIRIGLEHGQSWKDIALWSALPNPDVIEVGQVIRVLPPGTAPGEYPVATVGSSVSGNTAPARSQVQGTALPPAATSQTTTTATASSTTLPASPANTPSNAGSSDAPSFAWPASGAVIARFNESTNKGIDIVGKAGDNVLAAADGRVVYAGSGLPGYGHLIILKHNNTYLTAYAHNQKLLVREDQNVKKGQRIAEMGSSDTDRVKLHFEVRRNGKPVNPLTYLPER